MSGLDSTGKGFCENSDELGVYKGSEFLDQLNDCQLFKNSHAVWSLVVTFYTKPPRCLDDHGRNIKVILN